MHGYTILVTIGDPATMKPLLTEDSDTIEGSGQGLDHDAGK